MHIIDDYGYINVLLSILTLGLIIDVIVHLAKQMRNTGKWEINYSNLAKFILGSMLIMMYFISSCREYIEISMLIRIVVLLPLYSLLRNLIKLNK